ncbi:MAG: lytic transglycosylase domain-containing protein [Rickettsiales bacterium]|jgi:soluble lytic murein transglycosylase|nr:lytic transglycosylase domain-containing protein [Rickettsiales bacterium]
MFRLGIILRVLIFSIFIGNAWGNDNLFIKKHGAVDVKKYLPGRDDENIFRQIRKNIAAKNWKRAEALLKNVKSEGYRKAFGVYLKIKKFKVVFNMPRGEIIDMIEFNSKNSFLREFELLNRRIEFYYLNNIVKFSDVADYFNKFKSKDVNVLIKLLRDEGAKIEGVGNRGQKELELARENLNRKVRNSWINNSFPAEDQEIFLNSFNDKISEKNIIERAELLVYRWQLKTLAGLLPMIADQQYRELFSTIIKMGNYPASLDEIMKGVSKNLLENGALLYARAKYFESSGSMEETIRILNRQSMRKSKYAQFCYSLVVTQTRELMKMKRYREAYELVSGYSHLAEGERADILWLSGWLAFRYVKKYDNAYRHFTDLYGHVKRPISRAKAAYWLGRTAEEMGKRNDGVSWYRISSKFPLTFYGQLALYRIEDLEPEGVEPKIPSIPFPKAPSVTQDDMLNLRKNWLVRYALLCHSYENGREEAKNIFTVLISTILKTEGEIAGLIKIIETLDDDTLTFAMSIEASRRKVFFMDNIFPLMKTVKKTNVNRALIHAIAKQESGFVRYAESNMMAKGLMQIIPSTAREICRDLNIKYSAYRLKSDLEYNIKIADYYIKQLNKKFNGAKVLVIASYNAGPGLVGRWLEDFGDPRGKDIEFVIDWMESITSCETREYLQRVLEAFLVYETILGEEK